MMLDTRLFVMDKRIEFLWQPMGEGLQRDVIGEQVEIEV